MAGMREAYRQAILKEKIEQAAKGKLPLEDTQRLKRMGIAVPYSRKIEKRPLRRFAAWWETTAIEKLLEDLAFVLKNAAILDVINLIASITIILSLIGWWTTRKERRENELFTTWSVIKDASGDKSGVAKVAVERLHRNDFSLAGLNLNSANLEGANLEGALLEQVNLERADLKGANLQGAELWGANLRGAYLSEANLQDTILLFANFQGAYLLFANFQGANLEQVNFEDAALNNANLQGAYLFDANLEGADLKDANLENASLYEAHLQDITWNDETDWTNVKGLDSAKNIPDSLKPHLIKLGVLSPETNTSEPSQPSSEEE